MIQTIKFLLATFSIIVFVSCGKASQSPEAKLTELVPKFQKAMCSKTIECTKDEFAKIPPQYRNMIPAFMQSEDKCVTFFNEKMEEAKRKRLEEKKEITAEQVTAFETCIAALDKTTCDTFKGAKGKVTIPGCEDVDKFSDN